MIPHMAGISWPFPAFRLFISFFVLWGLTPVGATFILLDPLLYNGPLLSTFPFPLLLTLLFV